MAKAMAGNYCQARIYNEDGTSYFCTEPKDHGLIHVGHFSTGKACALWPRKGWAYLFCNAREPGDEGHPHYCTLEPGHKGNHKAVDNEGKVWREWKNDADPALPPEEAEARAWLATLEG